MLYRAKEQDVRRWLPVLAGAMLTAGCVSGPSGPSAPPSLPPVAAGQPHALIGMEAGRLISQFGQPRLDIRERTVRKLQFANGRCVLDAYLYARKAGAEPQVTHVDARSPNGDDVSADACVAALKSR